MHFKSTLCKTAATKSVKSKNKGCAANRSLRTLLCFG
jgi:hypothetical protein